MGLARTARYIPYDPSVPQGCIGKKYTECFNWFYAKVCIYPWMDEGEKYDMHLALHRIEKGTAS